MVNPFIPTDDVNPVQNNKWKSPLQFLSFERVNGKIFHIVLLRAKSIKVHNTRTKLQIKSGCAMEIDTRKTSKFTVLRKVLIFTNTVNFPMKSHEFYSNFHRMNKKSIIFSEIMYSLKSLVWYSDVPFDSLGWLLRQRGLGQCTICTYKCTHRVWHNSWTFRPQYLINLISGNSKLNYKSIHSVVFSGIMSNYMCTS